MSKSNRTLAGFYSSPFGSPRFTGLETTSIKAAMISTRVQGEKKKTKNLRVDLRAKAAAAAALILLFTLVDTWHASLILIPEQQEAEKPNMAEEEEEEAHLHVQAKVQAPLLYLWYYPTGLSKHKMTTQSCILLCIVIKQYTQGELLSVIMQINHVY